MVMSLLAPKWQSVNMIQGTGGNPSMLYVNISDHNAVILQQLLVHSNATEAFMIEYVSFHVLLVTPKVLLAHTTNVSMVNGHDILTVLPRITVSCRDKNQSNGEVNMSVKENNVSLEHPILPPLHQDENEDHSRVNSMMPIFKILKLVIVDFLTILILMKSLAGELQPIMNVSFVI